MRSATALALVLALAACAGNSRDNVSADAKSAVMLKVADDTKASGDAAGALSLYHQLHDTAPKDPVVLMRIGVTSMELANYGDAEKAYRAALEITPSDADARRGLAMALMTEGQPEQALAELKTALAANPNDARTHNAMGVAHDMMGKYQEAQQDYQAGLKIAPTSASLRNNLGMSLALAGNFDGAIMTLEGLGGTADAPTRFRLNLALAYGLAGKEDKAAAVARRVLDESSVKNNLEYYAMLRAMDGKARAAAIISAQLHGSAVASPIAKSSEVAANLPPAAAPQVPVAAAPLPATAGTPTQLAAAAPQPAAQDVANLPTEAAPAAPAPRLHRPHRKPAETAAAAKPAPAATPADAAAADPAAAGVEPEQAADAVPGEAAAPKTTVVAEEPASAPPVQTLKAKRTEARLPTKPVAAAAPASEAKAPEAHADAAPAQSEPVRNAPADVAPVIAEAGMPATSAAPAAAPETSEAVPQIAAGASGDRIVLQLGSFVLENSAHKVVEQCAAKGLEAHIGHSRDANGRDWFVVRSGEFASADDAKAAIGKFQEVAGVAPRLLHHRGASTVQSVETAAPAPQSAPREPHAVSEAASATVAEATAPTTTADGIAPVAFTPKAAGATPAPETAAAMAEITPAAAPASSHRVHADAGGEHVVVQLGSYQLESSARTVMKECAARGIEVKLGQTHDHDGRAWYIVRTGEFASSEEAAPVLHQIGEINGVTPLVIKHAGGAHHPTVTADSSGS